MNNSYLLRRVGQAILTIWVVITITFVLIRLLPGDPETFLMAMGAGAAMGGGGGDIEEGDLVDDVAYDPGTSLWEQYVDYVLNVLQGSLGVSTFFNQPVTDIIVSGLPWTLFIVSVAIPLVFGVGIVLGAILAYREGTRFDLVGSSISTLLNSVPYYIAAVIMVYVLGYQLGWFPTRGNYDSALDPGFNLAFIASVWYHAALPIASLVITSFGFRALAMRGNSIQVLGEDYVRVAELRGLQSRRIALQYVGRNAVLPIYTGLMIAIGFAIGGTVILEEIFQYRGIGYYFFMAIIARDYPLMMGAFLIITITVVISLFVADLTYGLIDPRASTESQQGGNSGTSFGYKLDKLLDAIVGFPSKVLETLRFNNGNRAETTATDVVGGGSSSDSLFETTSDVTLSRRERWRRQFEEFVVAPARIIWSDVRARIGFLVLGLYVFAGTVGVLLYPEPSHGDGEAFTGALVNPSHPLGTDMYGQDMLGLMIHATPAMLEMMIAGGIFATVVATIVGLTAGYAGGTTDRMLSTSADIVLAIPGLPLVMVLAVVFEPTAPWAVGIMLTVNAWGGTARQIRSQVLTIREQSYVEASGIMAISTPTILTKDVLPNVVPFVFVRLVDMARGVIVSSVALYFLGVLPFSNLNWGVVLNMAYENGALYSLSAAHWIFVPTFTIVLLTYGLILFAQGTDRVFNPQVRIKHADHGDDGDDDRERVKPPATAD